MASLVEDLQKDALKHEVSVTELLRKSLVVAIKLNLDEFASWVRCELDGYGEDEVPEYRIVYGRPIVVNPYHGYQPLMFSDVERVKNFFKMRFTMPIGDLEYDLIEARKSGSGVFHASYPPRIEKMLMDAMEASLQPLLEISASQFQRIIDAVRKIILEWSLKLEEEGITGEGISFTYNEKEKAHAVTYNIRNYINGNVKDSQIQFEAANSHQNNIFGFDVNDIFKLISSLKENIDNLDIDQAEKRVLQSEMQTLEAQMKSPIPNNSIIIELLSSVRRILEGAGGNIIASGLLNQFGTLFGI